MSPPHAWLTLVAAAAFCAAGCGLAAWFLVHVRVGMRTAERAYRAAHNRCLGCGYPLKGNVSGACPECGRPQPSPQSTEARLAASADLDLLATVDAVALMGREDAVAVAAVVREAANVAAAVELVVAAVGGGGRLIYVGAGTSGRLGVLDASECPPTFRTDPDVVQAVIAGGPEAVFRAVEGAEDDAVAGAAAMDDRGVGPADVVIGIAASGTTPFVWAALRRAVERGGRTVLLACAPPAAGGPAVDVQIRPVTGPEVLAGSTRLKAGTATKLVLNQITTVAMVRLGKTYGNRMVDLRAANAKLRDRATRMVRDLTGLDAAAATAVLAAADGHVKAAVVMARRGVTNEDARRLLEAAGGRLRSVIG